MATENGINTNYLVDLMMKSTRGPWVSTYNDDKGTWSIKANSQSHKTFVVKDVGDREISNFDLRLMGMAWVLGMEVLRLRKQLESTPKYAPQDPNRPAQTRLA